VGHPVLSQKILILECNKKLKKYIADKYASNETRNSNTENDVRKNIQGNVLEML
jgi:hypothetical protein